MKHFVDNEIKWSYILLGYTQVHNRTRHLVGVAKMMSRTSTALTGNWWVLSRVELIFKKGEHFNGKKN